MKQHKKLYKFLLLVCFAGISMCFYDIMRPKTLQTPSYLQVGEMLSHFNMENVGNIVKPLQESLGKRGEQAEEEEEEKEELKKETFYQTEAKDEGEWKTILFWNSWFGQDWGKRFLYKGSDQLREAGCPSWRCNFTLDRKQINSSDAIIFKSDQFRNKSNPQYRTPEQRWVWIELEAPSSAPAGANIHILNKDHLHRQVNWTMTYHSNSDVMAIYGFFLSKGEKSMPVRPNLMSQHPKAMDRYLASRDSNATLKDIMGPSWLLFVKRPKLVSWMSSHCGTNSRREQYVRELAKYVPVDKYGRCGNLSCVPQWPAPGLCWETNLGLNYLFYLSFENSLCNEYITEKLYFAMVYNLVPVVWGGSGYEYMLPPGSYINARNYHPKDLAELLKTLQADPVAYGRYHLWRGFWDVKVRGNFCELCHKLHTDKSYKHYNDIGTWRRNNGKCVKLPGTLSYDSGNAWQSAINPQRQDAVDNSTSSSP